MPLWRAGSGQGTTSTWPSRSLQMLEARLGQLLPTNSQSLAHTATACLGRSRACGTRQTCPSNGQTARLPCRRDRGLRRSNETRRTWDRKEPCFRGASRSAPRPAEVEQRLRAGPWGRSTEAFQSRATDRLALPRLRCRRPWRWHTTMTGAVARAAAPLARRWPPRSWKAGARRRARTPRCPLPSAGRCHSQAHCLPEPRGGHSRMPGRFPSESS
mmetsp:Transcript_11778/g.45958  ORF Transcript_11778/g.45958 Transcript_11778/m.45958 type:complete len:215 (-) Transcript_11778:764-1408(-)